MDASGDGTLVAKLLEVLEVSRDLAQATELVPLLERITRSALQVLECERASVFLYDSATGELRSLVASGGVEIRFPASRGIAGAAFTTAALINVPDAYADSRFNPAVDRVTGFRTRNMLACPLRDGDNKPIGVLQVLNKLNDVFDQDDQLLALTYTAQAGVAIQRQRLLDQVVRKQRIERALEIAREIQQAQLPKAPPSIPGYDIAGWNRPAEQTGGDFFDWIVTQDGRLAVVVADVAGHGIGPALVAAECRALLRSAFLRSARVDEVLPQANAILCEDQIDGRFVTAFLGVLNPRLGKMEFVSAGHGPVLFRESATATTRELPVTACPLGVDPDRSFSEVNEVHFAPGDILTILTDGFFEWRGEKGDMFGINRVRAAIDAVDGQPSSSIIEHLHSALIEFAGDSAQLDDLTAVIVKAV
jgi:phosphoserine phosphatase RsbU/P